jgi:hypothetical protein
MATRGRSETLFPNDVVSLTATFRDQIGMPADTDAFPQVTIIQPTGSIAIGPTSLGVSKIGTGKYQFDFPINITQAGIFSDNWLGYISGNRVEATFQFVVAYTNMPAVRSDGYEHLGDDIPFDFSQTAIHNINGLLKTLRARLRSRGQVKVKDGYGNDVWVDCDIFSLDTLVALLGNSLAYFNEIPHLTFFTFDDTAFVQQFHEVLVEGALMSALQGQALLETGAQQQISDGNANFQPANVGEMINGQYSSIYGQLFERIKFIKNYFKPHPMGLGRFNMLGGENPAIAKMRHKRQGRYF